nr:hypothetical protein [Planctomycetota bacterium]
RTREPMTYMTPKVDIRSEKGYWYLQSDGKWKQDSKGTGQLFKDPYPLSDKLFLVSHKPSGPQWSDAKAYGLYLLDDKGAVRLVYKDAEFSCWQPYPLRVRRKPPVLKTAFDRKLADKKQALCVVTDVYHGLEGVKRGEIKHIRIMEQVPRPWSARRTDRSDLFSKQHVVLSKGTNIGLKVQWGIVPVEPDGSAHFVVPADRNIYFQVLDENYLAVQTERSYVNYRPGETRACIGCHETPNSAAEVRGGGAVKALKRPPSLPAAQPGDKLPQRTLHYPTDVQPVLDKHCIKCHNPKKPKKESGGLDLSGRATGHFSVSYEALMGKIGKSMAPVSENSKPTVGYLPARSSFSFKTTIVAMLSKGKVRLPDKALAEKAAKLAKDHKEVNLSVGELLKISNWVEANCQYYGSYWGRRHVRFKTHPNFRPEVTFPQAISTTPPPTKAKR